MRSNNDYLGLTSPFYTDCLFKPSAGMILFYGRTCRTKSLFSLEFYGAFKGLTTNIVTFTRFKFIRERVYGIVS